MEGTVNAWENVRLARAQDRPYSADYIEAIFDEFMELHGDRLSGDDGALIAGIGKIDSRYVTVIAQQKGRTVKQNQKRNFGMASPDGYRKALRMMKLSEKFHRPVLCLIDTPGAFCGIEAEERGQAEAIARCITEMSALPVPVLSIIIGEGGSGGALALAAADEVWMMEYAVYSVLSPEGFASILWKDGSRAAEAAELMKMTAGELLELHVIDRILPENPPASIQCLEDTARRMKSSVLEFLNEYERIDPEELCARRYQRFRRF